MAAGALLMAEPVALSLLGALGPEDVLPSSTGMPTALRLVPGWGLSPERGAIAIYAAEFVVGLGLLASAALRARYRTARPQDRARS
jgi:hypothetical protein